MDPNPDLDSSDTDLDRRSWNKDLDPKHCILFRKTENYSNQRKPSTLGKVYGNGQQLWVPKHFPNLLLAMVTFRYQDNSPLYISHLGQFATVTICHITFRHFIFRHITFRHFIFRHITFCYNDNSPHYIFCHSYSDVSTRLHFAIVTFHCKWYIRTDQMHVHSSVEILDRSEAVQDGYSTYKTDAVQDRCSTVIRTGQKRYRSDAGQYGCWTGRVQDRKGAGQVRCKAGQMQYRKDAGQDWCRSGKAAGQEVCRTGRMQDRKAAGQEGCRTGRLQDRKLQERKDAGQEGCRTGRLQDRKYAGLYCEWWFLSGQLFFASSKNA